MSKVQNPIIGAASQQAGGMVFSRTCGQNIMRAKPFGYHYNPSAAQKRKVPKFKAGNELASKVKGICKPLYPRLVKGQTHYSALLSDFSKAFDYTGETLAYFPELVYFGSGTKPGRFPTLTLDQLNWILSADYDDWLAIALLINPEFDDWGNHSVILSSEDGSIVSICPLVLDPSHNVVKISVPELLNTVNFYVSGWFFSDGSIKYQTRSCLTCDGVLYGAL